MRKNIYKKQYGFSLIETLIAVSILMIAIAGPLTLVQAGLFSSNHQRNQVTAMYLAQEALEYIKNLRDSNSYTQYINSPDPADFWLAGPDPDNTSLVATCVAPGCYVDPHQNLPGSTFIKPANFVTPVNDLYLTLNTAGTQKFYSYGSDTASLYKRTVTITPVPVDAIDSDEVTVSVRIDWKDNALPRSYTVSENIYNYEQP